MEYYCPHCGEELKQIDGLFSEYISEMGLMILDYVDPERYTKEIIENLISEIEFRNNETMEYRNSLDDRRKKFVASLDNKADWGKELTADEKKDKISFWDKIAEENSELFDVYTLFKAKVVINKYIKNRHKYE